MSNISFSPEGIPIISLKNYFSGNEFEKKSVVDDVANACKNVGCFFVQDHNVSLDAMQKCINDMSTFFHLPLDEKLKYRSTKIQDGRGYVPLETENIHAFMGRPGRPNDPVEKFVYGPVEGCPYGYYDQQQYSEYMDCWRPNVYPDNPITLKQNVIDYYDRVKKFAENLMAIFSSALSLPENFIREKCNFGAHPMKVNFYNSKLDQENLESLAEHTDYSVFTLLFSDQNSKNSLMVRDVDGVWRYANPPPFSFFVNIGDCLARWTNGKWQATPHKVIFRTTEHEIVTRQRISVVFFVLMNHDAVIECMPSCLDVADGIAKFEPVAFEKLRSLKIKSLVTTKAF